MELELHELFNSADVSDVSVSGAAALNTDRIKMLTLSRIQEKPRRKTAPRIFLAAAIAAALAVSAVAYAEFQKYEKPEQMLEGFYGNTQQDSVIGEKRPWGELPDSERVALDLQAARLVAPFIADVGRTVKEEDTVLTVHSNLYDSVTGCGILYYSLENPKGIQHSLDYDGLIHGIPVYNGTRHGYGYLLKGQSTDTRLEIAEYYIRGPHDEENYVELGLNLPKDYVSPEDEFDMVQKAIQVPLDDGGGMDGLFSQGIRLSPIGIALDMTDMGFLEREDQLRTLEILYVDGSRYLVLDDTHQNYIFGACSDSQHLVMPFNRLVDVSQVEAVVLNGQEIRGLEPISDQQRLRYTQYVDHRGTIDKEGSTFGGSIANGNMTLVPGKLLYSSFTGNGLFTCSLLTDNPEKLLQNGMFIQWEAQLESNMILRWECLEEKEGELKLRGTFANFHPETKNLKLWFEGSKADPRIETSTEHLICVPLEGTSESGITLENGSILVSDLGMVIDYESLGVHQDSMPKDLSLQFTDGTTRIISSWDEDILDCGWLWSEELRDSREKKVYVSFLEPVDAETVEAVHYAGHTYHP